MLNERISQTANIPQGTPARDVGKFLVDAYQVRTLAEQILRLRTRNPRALLMADASIAEQDALLEDAALALLGRDPAHHRPALYVGADDLNDVGAMQREDRAQLIAALDLFLRAYRKAIAGGRVDECRRLGLLALADMQGGQ